MKTKKGRKLAQRPARTPQPELQPEPQPEPQAEPQAEPNTSPDTIESLIAEARAVLEEADRLLPTLPRIYLPYPEDELLPLIERLENVEERLGELPGDPQPSQILEAALIEPGKVPSIARPGRFVEWIGWVPVLCEWGGLISRSSMELRAIDPAQRWLTSSGYRSLYDARYVSGDSGVRALFRHVLSNMATSKGFDLLELGEHAREAAANQLALPENEWLRQALKAGPVDPVPLPSRLWAVQTSLFAA